MEMMQMGLDWVWTDDLWYACGGKEKEVGGMWSE